VLFSKGVPLDPDLNKYDLEHALTPHAPVTEDETQTFELFTHKKSAREAVDHARKVKLLTGGAEQTPLISA
jgi:hypothetical protein